MKKIILIIFGLIFISTYAFANSTTTSKFGDNEVNLKDVFANKFYKYDSNGKVIYLSKEDIAELWQNQLAEEGKNVKFEKFEILTSKDDKTNKVYYFLKTVSNDKTIETGAFFTKTKLGMLLTDKECSCAGCPNGCNLTVFGSTCSCSSCGYGGNQTCTKTEKAVVKGFE